MKSNFTNKKLLKLATFAGGMEFSPQTSLLLYLNGYNLRIKEGPIAEQSNLLNSGWGDPSLNPGEGCYGDGELS